MRSKLLLVGAVAATVAGLGTPVNAAGSGDTTVTFVVPSGALSITVPPLAGLPSGAPGTTVGGTLGTVAVTDARALLSASWSATVTSTDFKTGAGTPEETITKDSVFYWSGAGKATAGNGTFLPGQPTSASKQPLSAAVTAYSMSGGVGRSSAVWTPSLVVTLPPSAITGSYSGTVIHSVA